MVSVPDFAPNRTLILEDARWWISMINEANGFPISLGLDANGAPSVLEEMHAFDAVKVPFPAVCVFEAETSPPPSYESFGTREMWIDIQIVGHVQGSTPTERKLLTDLLQQSIHEALRQDRMRDGWAVDTAQLAPTRDDAAVAAKLGTIGAGSGTFVQSFRCRYYPDDDTERAMAHGEIYQTASALTAIVAAPTYTPANGTTALGQGVAFPSPGAAVDFAMSDSNGNPVNGRLRYTGAKTRWFLVEATGSLTGSATTDVLLALRQTGAFQAKSVLQLVPSTTDRRAFHVKALLYMAQNDYVDLALAGAAQNVTIQNLNLSCTQVPKF